MKRILLYAATVVALVSLSSSAQVTIPNTFVAGTTIFSADVNENFTALGAGALNRTGGTITGNIAVDNGITIDGRDISADLDQAVKTTSSPTFAGVTVTTFTSSQIAFPASQSASSDANTLDDYEEGTYTPSWTGTGVSIGNGTLEGRYIKIGKQVTTHIRFVFGSSSNAGSGSWNFSLPFTAETASGFAYLGPVMGTDSLAGNYFAFAQAFAAGTTLQITSGGGTLDTWDFNSPFTWGTDDSFRASFTYTASQ